MHAFKIRILVKFVKNYNDLYATNDELQFLLWYIFLRFRIRFQWNTATMLAVPLFPLTFYSNVYSENNAKTYEVMLSGVFLFQLNKNDTIIIKRPLVQTADSFIPLSAFLADFSILLYEPTSGFSVFKN